MPVGAPIAKRLALSALSLRVARLPAVTPGLVARLAGNWVSVLQYRKCLSSLIDDLFLLSSQCSDSDFGVAVPLPRRISQELVLLSSMAPLICSNLSVNFLDRLFATDASCQKGGIVSAEIPLDVHEALWLGTDKRGAYTQLANPFHAVLRSLGEADDDLETSGPWDCATQPQKSPLMYFDFVEICGGAGKVGDALHARGWNVAPVLDLSESAHYDLGSLRLLEWIIHMIEEGRFRSFMVEPPCTTFSPAAHPAVRSYREPLGFDRLDPKTLPGNLLAFRALILLRVGRRCGTPCAAEQSRLSKMCWLTFWISLLDVGFEEAVMASCMFGSPHRKEFRLLCYLLDVAFLDTRCCGGHSHVRIQGSLTKPSAVYVDGLADRIAAASHRALTSLNACQRLEPEVVGLESPVVNDLALSSKWSLVRAWFWKRGGHINVLEQASAVSLLDQLSCQTSSVRFASLIDSAVCRGSLSKGRSASVALQPGLKKAGAICVAADLYPVWPYCPTRLNTADDPTRSVSVRAPVCHSLVKLSGFSDLAKASSGFLRRFAANWFRLVLLALLVTGSDSVSCGSEPGSWISPFWISDLVHVSCVGIGLLLPLLVALWTLPWILPGIFGETRCAECDLWWTSGRVGTGRVTLICKWTSKGRIGLVVRAMVLLCCLVPAGAMPIGANTAVEHAGVLARAGNNLVSSRAVRPQTRDKRLVYLERFRRWLLEEKSTSLRMLLEQKPPDPEKVNDLLIEYGKQLYYGGKAYGIYAETVNAIAAERPLIRRQLTAAWDLAFCWLADEPTCHHPAMPLSILTAMVTTALTWGWPYEAAVLMLSWAGVMRIGEVLCALRRDLVLPVDAAPGTSFALVIIRAPKTRGRAANHQSARIDQSDIIAFLTSMYGSSPADSSIWPYSAATLRKRFVNLLNALELPTEKRGEARPFDLGSLRPGGATWLLHHTGDLELVRHRGRWLSVRTMNIYLQEVQVATYIVRVAPRTRFLIEVCAGAFAFTLARAIAFLDSGIPPAAWYALLKISAGSPSKSSGKDGKGGLFEPRIQQQPDPGMMTSPCTAAKDRGRLSYICIVYQ